MASPRFKSWAGTKTLKNNTMNLQEISELQDKIETLNESLLDAKELLIDGKIISSRIFSDLNYKSQVLISSLLNLSFLEYDSTIDIEEKQIFEMICNVSGKTEEEIRDNSQKRDRETLIPRQVHESILHATFKRSLGDAGKVYGKNHSTILHSIKTINNLLDTDVDFREKYGYIFLLCNKINPDTRHKINIHKLNQQV